MISKKVYIIILESMNHYGFVTDNDKDKIKLYLETYANTNDQNEKQIYNTMSDSPAKTPKSFQLSRINSYEC